MRAMQLGIWTLTAVVGITGVGAGGPKDEGTRGRKADQDALKRFGPLVGAWKGTGQVKRGSSQGAWTETGDWAWKLTPDSAQMELQVAKGKYLRSATLAPSDRPGSLQLNAVLADGSKRAFVSEPGMVDDSTKPLAFRATDAGEGVRRISLATPNESRFLITYEALPTLDAPPVRLGEVGSTRVGASFAATGEAGPICIVTGGRGTTQVMHNGKSYWVCCSGCRDLFNDDPAAVLADAAAKKNAKP